MRSLFAFSLALLPLLGLAYLVDPPSTAAPDTIEDCTYWHVANETDTCPSISESSYITEAQFTNYNPSLANGCQLIAGNSYCIEQDWGIPRPTSTTSSPATSTIQTPTATPSTFLQFCQYEAGGYSRYCSRCLINCANEAKYISDCFQSVFSTINRYDSECWQHAGIDCANQAVDRVCSQCSS